MNCWKRTSRNGAWWLILLVAASTGCKNDPKAQNDIAPGAIPQPNGAYLCQWTHAQMARADRDSFVIYQYEWSAEPATLTPGGREHLDSLRARLAQSTCPIVVETSNDDQLDASRRAAIISALAATNGILATDRVVVGRSPAEGLYGQEAPGVANGILSGQGGGGGSGATSSTGGGATSGGGAISGGATSGGGIY